MKHKEAVREHDKQEQCAFFKAPVASPYEHAYFSVPMAFLYVCDVDLNVEVVNHYKALGLEKLTALLHNDPPEADLCFFSGKLKLQLRDGCHRARAMYELGGVMYPVHYRTFDNPSILEGVHVSQTRVWIEDDYIDAYLLG